MKSESKIASFFRYLFIEIRELKPLSKIEAVIAKMNLAEKIFFYIFACICIISSLVLLFRVNDYFLIEIPSFGGKFTEGVVGSPRFINPVLVDFKSPE
jgi:hypothetical protein